MKASRNAAIQAAVKGSKSIRLGANLNYNLKDTGLVVGDDWTAEIQNALDNYARVYIPYKATPYILSDRLLISSNTWLTVHPDSELFLANGTNTCMIRNRNILSVTRDHDIHISGGIWNGNRLNQTSQYQLSDKVGSVFGVSGNIDMMGVVNFSISKLTVNHAKGFAVHISGCENFTVRTIALNTGRDGVHISGPNLNGLVSDISGYCYDDFVALNAWDWLNSSPLEGNITNVIIEKLRPTTSDSGVIRLLAANDVTIDNVIIRDVVGTSNNDPFKLYYQADAEYPAHVSTPNKLGTITFDNITTIKQGSIFKIGQTVDRLNILNSNCESVNDGNESSLIDFVANGRLIDLYINNHYQKYGNAFHSYTGLLENVLIDNSIFDTLKRFYFSNSAYNSTIKVQNSQFNNLLHNIVRNDGGAISSFEFVDCTVNNSVTALTKVSGSVRWRGNTVPVDISQLTPVAGDACINSNAALSCGIGSVVRNAGNTLWTNTVTGLTY